ncbi:hypothetical protein T484DRAFT_1907248 [Baffinella frigidus]|nr:hypothetical protein T484DRAFT_1907248 [Cryptophyta sp. CCMP2293]
MVAFSRTLTYVREAEDGKDHHGRGGAGRGGAGAGEERRSEAGGKVSPHHVSDGDTAAGEDRARAGGAGGAGGEDLRDRGGASPGGSVVRRPRWWQRAYAAQLTAGERGGAGWLGRGWAREGAGTASLLWGRLAIGDRVGASGGGEKRGVVGMAGVSGEKWSEDDERGEEAGHSDGGGAEAREAGGGWGMGECEHARVLVGHMELDEDYLRFDQSEPWRPADDGSGFQAPMGLGSRAESEDWWAEGD